MYLDETDKTKFEELHKSIRACDDVLSSVETNLTSFRNDLAAVSADIETLQARSTALNVRLGNRKTVEKGLGPVVEELSVSPLVVSKIAEGHIDESWIKVLAEVERRAEAYKKNPNQRQSKSLADLGPLLEKLTLKVSNEAQGSGCLSGANSGNIRPLKGYAIFSLPRSRLFDRHISMPRLSSSRISSSSGIYSHSYTDSMPPWPMRFAWLT